MRIVRLGRDYPLKIAWTEPNGWFETQYSTNETTQHSYLR